MTRWLLILTTFIGLAVPVRAQQSVVGSPHDLSSSGPGRVRALEEEEVCIFCHAPHNATGQAPLWNRFERRLHYRIYESSTTDARIDQPTGSSKMCLSCHDGATAVGLIASRPGLIDMTEHTLPPGPSDLTEDLSDDHPIGFRYDRALAVRDRQLRFPQTVTSDLPLGAHGEVQCMTCHDAHDNRHGDFLRVTSVRSAICTACHDMLGWRHGSHAVSPAPVTGRSVDPQNPLPFDTVADNACTNCHRIHSARQPERLLRAFREEDNCLTCHNGSVARTNLQTEFRKRSAHPIFSFQGRHDPGEDFRRMQRHVECEDCHNPHAVMPKDPRPSRLPSGSVPVSVGPTTKFVSGVDRNGRQVDHARFDYEICLKCHADSVRRSSPAEITRQITQANTRLEFQTTNPSFHPVFGPRQNDEVVSLIAPLQVGTVIGCTDCHGSDAMDRGGPAGPHGSVHEPLLVANYSTRDLTAESPTAYALCYRCHDRQSILSDESFPLHRVHVVNGRSPCSACHDAHGISRTQGTELRHSNLINFDLSIVRPVVGSIRSRVEFVDMGRRQGSCTLACHGVLHVNFEYGR